MPSCALACIDTRVMDPARAIVSALDTCRTLTPEQYSFLLQQAAEHLSNSSWLANWSLNAGRQRVVRLDSPTLNFGKACEELLSPEDTNSLALCVLVYGDLEQKKKKRGGGLPEGVKYDGNGFPGRINFLPSDRGVVPLIGKQSATWDRYKADAVTHNVSGYQVRLVEPNPDQPFRSKVVAAAPAEKGGVQLTLADLHPFKSGQAIVSLTEIHPSVDGHVEVHKKVDAGSFIVKGGIRADGIDFPALTAQLKQPGSNAYAEERYTLQQDLCMIHIVLTRASQPAGPLSAAVAQQRAAARAAPGASSPAAAAGPVVTVAGLGPQGQMLPLVPGAMAVSPPQLQGIGAGLLSFGWPAVAVQQGQVLPHQQQLPLMPPLQFQPQHQQQHQQIPQQQQRQSGTLAQLFQQAHQPPAAPATPAASPSSSGWLKQLLRAPDQPPAASTFASPGAVEEPPEAVAESPNKAASTSAGAGGGAASKSPSTGPAAAGPASAAAGGAPESAPKPAKRREYFFTEKATVGGQDPGRAAHPDRQLVVQGGALVAGGLRVEGELNHVSDARRKTDIVVVGEVELCMKLAATISIHTFRFKGREANQLGFIAQQVAEQVQLCGAEHFNLVKKDAHGELCLDLVGHLAMLHGAVQGIIQGHEQQRDQEMGQEVQLQFLMTAVGSIDSRLESMNSLLKKLQRVMQGEATPALHASASAASGAVAAAWAGDTSTASSGSRGSLTTMLEDEEEFAESDAEMTEADGMEGSCSGGVAGAGSGAQACIFAGLSPEEVAAKLLLLLGEQAPQLKLYQKFAEQLSPEALQELYEAATCGPADLTAKADRHRSLGGQFISLAKKRIHADKIRREATAASGLSEAQLRSYQQQVIQVARSGANLIVVAPTGSGKTAIVIRHAAVVLGKDPKQRIVFLAPTVALAQQQAGAFLAMAPFSAGKYRVECRCGENPITPREWEGVLHSTHVLVMTPQSLLNLLETGHAHMDQINLLLLDECHHAKDDHPTAKVLEYYHKSSQQTQIIGLTASPTSKSSVEGTYQGLLKLKANLDANYVILDKDKADVQEFVPKVNERPPLWVYPRQEDRQLAVQLGSFALLAVEQLETIISMPASWCLKAAGRLQAAAGYTSEDRPDLTCCLMLVRGTVNALALVGDTGYEAAVRHLSKEYAAVAEKVVGSLERLGPALASDHGSSSLFPRTLELLRRLLSSALDLRTLQEAYRSSFSGISRHPKFLKLREVLLERAALPAFHGIVFARTREAVRSLTRLIKDCPDLQFLEVYAFMGHGGRKGEGGAKGMRVKEQQQVMEQFKAPGRKLLVSTSAGEEGIDVPNCEFVVRYTATQTGRERIQSRGRTRMASSEYIQILEAGGQEQELSLKSAREEANLHSALQHIEAVRIA